MGYDGTSVDADPGGAGPQQLLELLHGAAAQVALLVRDHHDVGVTGTDLAELVDQVVLAVAHGAQAQQQPRRPGGVRRP